MGFKHRVLRKISLPISVEVAGGWRILHSEELHDLSSSYFGWSNKKAWDMQEM
jgi:hypothetical protein